MLVLLAVAIAAAPVLASGCGEDGGEPTNEVVIGFLADFTGVSALTSIELHKGFNDYMKMAEEEGLIEGVKVKLPTYDTRLDYARVVPGYLWLKGQGSDLIWDFSPIFCAMLVDKQQEDQIPSYTFQSDVAFLDQPWMWSFGSDYTTEAEAIIEWILKDWEDKGEAWPVVVGHAEIAGYQSSVQMQAVFEDYADQYPDKMTIKAAAAPLGNTSWASEYEKLKGCDIIVCNLLGPSMATWLRECVERGYQGRHLGSSLAFMGFWELAREAVGDISKLNGCLAIHNQMLWTDDTPFVAELNAALEKYRPGEAAEMKKGTSWPTGWLTGMILTDVIMRAVEAVGAENVDAAALNDSLAATDIPKIDGWGEAFKFRDGSNVLYRMYRIIDFRSSANEWFALTDWFVAPRWAS